MAANFMGNLPDKSFHFITQETFIRIGMGCDYDVANVSQLTINILEVTVRRV